MKTTHIIKLSTGKEITLNDDEYRELKQEFKEVETIPYYLTYPSYPGIPVWPWNLTQICTTTTSDTAMIDKDRYNSTQWMQGKI